MKYYEVSKVTRGFELALSGSRKKKVCKGQRSVVKVQRVYKRRTASYFPSNEDDEMTKTNTASTAG